jgi:hypothetical protein
MECKEYIEAMTAAAYLTAGFHWPLTARWPFLRPLSMISAFFKGHGRVA